MGTNYYLKPKSIFQLHIEGELHIGKSSAGWPFSLHVYPEKGINTFKDWEKLLVSGFYIIEDEYKNQLELDTFLQRVTQRKYSQRHNIDGWHCIGHGEGSWDYIQGDFF